MATSTSKTKTPAKNTSSKTAAKPATTVKTAAAKTAAAKPAAPKKTTAAKPAAKPKAAKPAAKSAKHGGAVTPEQRRFYVEVAAYYIAERRGFHGGSQLADWAQAEKEIDELLAAGRINA